MTKVAITTLLLLLLFFFLLFLSPSTAEIKSLKIDSDTRPFILLENFGFTHTGHVTISLSSVSVTSQQQQQQQPPDSSLLGFLLLTEESLFQALLAIQKTPNVCLLNFHYIPTLFTFTELSLSSSSTLFNRSFPVPSPNEYSLYFTNCAADTSVSMNIRTELYNLDANGRKDFLSVGQTQLPSMFFLFSLAYLLFITIWIYVCGTNRLSLRPIHLLMGTLLLMKAFNLICAAEEAQYVKITGTPQGWDVLLYIFQFIRVILLFTVVVLIGAGWSSLKPFLEKREKKVLMVVILLQVLANVASVVKGETGPYIKDWVIWNQVFLLVDVICCCAIIFPIVWSIRSLREASKNDGKVAKLQLFWHFRAVVIVYLFFTRVVVYALRTIVVYKYQWVSNFAEEAASLMFYVVMFYMFRPVESNEYLLLDEEEEEAAKTALREEEFGLLK